MGLPDCFFNTSRDYPLATDCFGRSGGIAFGAVHWWDYGLVFVVDPTTQIAMTTVLWEATRLNSGMALGSTQEVDREWVAAKALRYLLGVSALLMLGYGGWIFVRGEYPWFEIALVVSLTLAFVWSVVATYFSQPWNNEHWPHERDSSSALLYQKAALVCALATTGLTFIEPTFFHTAFWLSGMAIALHRSLPFAWGYVGLGLMLIGYGQGYLTWPVQPNRLLIFGLEALQFLVLTGLLFVFLREVLKRQPATVQQPVAVELLSTRELEVLRLVARGMSNKQIAKNLGLSEGTVKNYVSVILEKLQVKNRTQAANTARDLQLF